MNNKLKIFDNSEFGSVRVIDIDGEPWFVGKDVATILGYSNASKALNDHVDDDDKLSNESLSSLGQRGGWLINESGLYSLILSSKLPTAKQFKRWITSEILPSIRQHGMYATPITIDKLLNNPKLFGDALQKLKDEHEKRIEAERKNSILMHVNKTYTVTEIAKECGLSSAQELNQILSEKGIQFKINKTWVLYSDYATRGYFETKQEVLDNGVVVYYRRITQLGRVFILDLLNDNPLLLGGVS